MFLAMSWPARSEGQGAPLYVGMGSTDARFEATLDARIGFPEGSLRVGENGTHGTRLNLRKDLSMDFSEALEASLAFHFTPRDAVRATGLYYFLEGSQFARQGILYDGDTFGQGRVRANADFYRLSLDYERLLLNGYGMFLTGTAGLTYVHLDPKLSGQGRHSRENFYRHELPVPIAGIRIDIPMGDRFAARASVGGGGLPAVDSLRKEDGRTVHLTQIHVDGGLAVTYAVTRNVLLEAGYRYTYFFQHETSRETDNAFELSDNGFRFGLSVAF